MNTNTQTRTATVSIDGPDFDFPAFWRRQAQSWRERAEEYRHTARIAMRDEDQELFFYATQQALRCEQWAKEDEQKAL